MRNVILAIVMLMWGTTWATSVTYQESVDGDLSEGSIGGVFQQLAVLNFDTGVNTVSGTTGFAAWADPPDVSFPYVSDFDSFAFTIPDGTKITSATLQMVQSAGNQSQFVGAIWTLRSGSSMFGGGDLLGYFSFDFDSGTSYSPPVEMSGPGLFNLSQVQYAWRGDGPPATGDYVFSFQVEPCETFPGGGNTGGCFPGPGPFPASTPGTLVLLGLGLAGLGVALRRKPYLASA